MENEKEYNYLKNKVKLDLLSMEEELMEMPVLIQMCGEYAANALDRVNISKDYLGTVKAQVASKLRSETLSTGKTRSESQIDSELEGIKEVIEAMAIYTLARGEAALWSALMESLQTKNYSIRVAAELIKAGVITTDYILSKRRGELRK